MEMDYIRFWDRDRSLGDPWICQKQWMDRYFGGFVYHDQRHIFGDRNVCDQEW